MVSSKKLNSSLSYGKLNKKMLLLFAVVFAVIGSWVILKSQAATLPQVVILDYGSVSGSNTGLGTSSTLAVTTTTDLDGIPYVSNNNANGQPPQVTAISPGGIANYAFGGKSFTPVKACFLVKVPMQGKNSVATSATFTFGANSETHKLLPSLNLPANYQNICLQGDVSKISVSVTSGYLLYVYHVLLY